MGEEFFGGFTGRDEFAGAHAEIVKQEAQKSGSRRGGCGRDGGERGRGLANRGCGGRWLGGGLGGEGSDLAGLAALFDDEIAARESPDGVIAAIADDHPDFHEAGFGLEDVLRARAQLEALKVTSLGGMFCCAGRNAVRQSRTDRRRMAPLLFNTWRLGFGAARVRQVGQQRHAGQGPLARERRGHAQAFCACSVAAPSFRPDLENRDRVRVQVHGEVRRIR